MGRGVSFHETQSGRHILTLTGAQDLTLLGPNVGNRKKGIPARAIVYSGACTIIDASGNTEALVATTDYFYLPVQVAEVVSSANSYMVIY